MKRLIAKQLKNDNDTRRENGNSSRGYLRGRGEFYLQCSKMFPPNVKFDPEGNDAITILNAKLKKIEEQNNYLQKELKNVSSMLAKHMVYLERLSNHVFPKTLNFNFFPFKSKEEMDDVEKNVKSMPTNEVMEYIRETIGPNDISKSLNKLFTEEFLLSLNWDGNQKKLALRKYKIFSKYAFDAVKREDYDYSDYEASMRKGFRKMKNRVYRRRYNNKLTSEAASTLDKN
ncbi:uncharacterized protein LOC118751335 isoform X1 [Rhagoletis pomonella]|uniref:uncharacterized protein LOC118750963 isoform X3 n=1 Tax=Rhagoletis pomonella TaxID=28610 RepID=UPI00178591DE|nr:uncharacterized protein LOC118750963 isoform X3 [Rhagoletis pomonella]XP_036341618.1 uncharacterized protein LOC118750971 isoform X1 [Rhagoletis pomonella]XP_036341996.1 uncharacterized protein LOC118751324 isoform X1 [Rhagoletis pomonella]XP_036342026.1 uncharacterized protein LOC118751335 isoform X1 [Rhagoletis pomonella]